MLFAGHAVSISRGDLGVHLDREKASSHKHTAARAKARDAQANRAKANFGELAKQFDEFVKRMTGA